MSDVESHVDAWLAAGLIDRETADRLRAAEPAAIEPRDQSPTEAAHEPKASRLVSGMFGPSVTVAEAFLYLGGSFLLAAWFALIGRMASESSDSEAIIGVGGAIAAVALIALGIFLRRGDPRRGRAAGVVFVVATATAGGSALSFATQASLSGTIVAVIGAAVSVAVAIGLRWLHPAVLTQVGLLAASTSLAGALLTWFQELLFPAQEYVDFEPIARTGPDPIVLVLASAAWWLVFAVLVGLIGLREARSVEPGHDGPAARRAGLSRLWAGFVAVIGLAVAVSTSDFDANFEYGRVLEPWIGDLALLVLSGVLIERAFRREAASYVFAAALGLILAMSDFNFTYLSESTESGLLIEGLILLGAGLAADRLRRRIGRPDDRPPTAREVALEEG